MSNDTDRDGLSDRMEKEIGTDPAVFDTDNDGRGDGEELLVSPYTDPLDPDTDGDGLPDGRELQLITSPVNPDTDGDLRPDGFEFWSGTDPNNADLPPAQRDMDGDGLSDSFELGTGTSISLNDTDGDGLSDGLEHVLGTSPVQRDTDGDGIDDRSEIFATFTSPQLNDTDGDGLSDRLEKDIGTSPRVQDTDQDGLNDMKELDLGTDPLDPDSDGGGVRDLLEVSFGKDPLDPFDDSPFPEDEDGDGLPDLLELSINTSVSDWDTDGDLLSDGTEFFTSGTDPLEPDTDGDGLPDGDEVIRYQTDPLDRDTDGDGLDDGKEVKNRRSSPLLPDTDSDGLPDGIEEEIGTAPRNPDTDGDGLLDGVEYYITLTDPLDPDTDGGSVPDGTEIEFGGDPLDPLDDPLYLDSDGDGLTDREEDINGNGIVDQNETDPNDPDTDGDSVWDSYELRGVLGTPSDPLDPDTDDDSLWDGEELLPGEDGFVSDPTLNDTDGDGLEDADEVFGTFGFKSDPSSTDGDHDSLLDPQELFVSTTDPLDQDTDGDGLPDGWIDGWMGRPRNGEADPGEFEDRNLNGMVDAGIWNEGEGPGETDPLKYDTDGGMVGDGDEVLHRDIDGRENPFDPLDPLDDVYILDTDGDGLTDIEENLTYRTNWMLVDTDSDGMADGYLDIMVEGVVHPGELTGHNGWGPTDPLRAHSDADGLADGVEYGMGTDPNAEDTDQDGLYDGYDMPDHPGELSGRNRFDPFHPYGPTDPLDPDSDDDGLWDGDNVPMGGSFFHGEFQIGTDPNDPDTDGDGLSDHFEFTAEYDDPKVKWSDSPSNFKKTNPLDPDTDGGLMGDGLEVEKGLNPLDPDDDDHYLDSDGDGLLNIQEKRDPSLSYSNTSVDWTGDGINDRRPDPDDPDTDGDGLTDGEEVLVHRTNPVHNDTDGDGLKDGEEILVHRTNPLRQDSDLDGLSDETEVRHIFEGWQSYVDWDGDGALDNRTDPNNPNTDLDADDDGREVKSGTNPLDPGDPGSEYQPERSTRVLIASAPSIILKTNDPFKGSFKVTGQVLSEDNRALEGVMVTVLVVPAGTGPEDALEMERNPSLVVGSSSTGEDGWFLVGCVPVGTIPHGDVSIYAVSRARRMDGRLFLPSASQPASAEVRTSSRFSVETGSGPYSVGSTIPFTGRLQDSGTVGIAGAKVSIGWDRGGLYEAETGPSGHFSIPLEVPSEPGSYTVSISYEGSFFIGPSSVEMDIFAVDGPTILLERIDGSVETGAVVHINGTIFGMGADPQGEVSVSLISEKDATSVLSLDTVIENGAFSTPIEIVAEVFRSGVYIVEVEYDPGSYNLAVNASLRFTVTSRSYLLLGEPMMVRGLDDELNILLVAGDMQPLPNEVVRLTFKGSPWLGSYTGRTNRTGWAAIEVPLPLDIPLGPVEFVAVHEPSADTVVGGSLAGYLMLMAETRIEIFEGEDTFALEDDIVIRGRLIDDLGEGILGDPDIEMILNGAIVETSGTDERGFFELTHAVSTFTPRGRGLITVRFTDIPDERAGLYSPSFVSWEVTVFSRVTAQTSFDTEGRNTTLTVSLRDQNREPVSGAQVRIGTTYSTRTYITGDNGTLIVSLDGAEPGDIVILEFPGDPERYLVPFRTEVLVPSTDAGPEGRNYLWVYLFIIGAAVAAAAAVTAVFLDRFRRGKGSRRAEEARTDSLYSFKPREGSQEMICTSYAGVLSDLRGKGVVRPPEMTPDEYDGALRRSAEEGSLRDMEDLTRLFDEARYSDHEMSSHLITKAKGLSSGLRKEVASMDGEGLTDRFEKARTETALETRRHPPWKMRVDHEEDLRALLGDKEAGA